MNESCIKTRPTVNCDKSKKLTVITVNDSNIILFTANGVLW